MLGVISKKPIPNGAVSHFTYDQLGKIKTVKYPKGGISRYTYDLLGNVTKEMQKADYAPLNKTKTYVYDSTSQLLKATENGATSEYSYDNFGNLAKEVVSGREIIYNYNNLNQLVGKTAESDSYSYSYDQRGNLVSETKNGAVVKTYTYNAENKMVKGENKETGEASEYEYNALGYRTDLTQKKKNGNASFVNNLNSFGNNYSEFVQEIAKKDSDTEQKTFEDVLGLTRQLLLPTVKTEFVADYTSYAKADLVAYENGSYTTTYTYGENDEKISQSISHHVGLTDVLAGKNPLAQIATTNIKKAYYHKTRQGSTAYVTDKDGQVLAFTEYDAWGKMETQKPSTMNSAGLDDITDYTGHTYDEVLDKYFAQARFYDAVNRRFITEDPVKDGVNWYAYVGNNPVNAIDPTGNYAMPIVGIYNNNVRNKAPEFIISVARLIKDIGAGLLAGMTESTILTLGGSTTAFGYALDAITPGKNTSYGYSNRRLTIEIAEYNEAFIRKAATGNGNTAYYMSRNAWRELDKSFHTFMLANAAGITTGAVMGAIGSVEALPVTGGVSAFPAVACGVVAAAGAVTSASLAAGISIKAEVYSKNGGSVDTNNGMRNGWKFDESVDVDYRGTRKTYNDALNEAFKRTGESKSDFQVTKWAKDKYGKSSPVEWRSKSGAEVNIDTGHTTNGPTLPHVGYQTGGKRGNGGAIRGHILVNEVPFNR